MTAIQMKRTGENCVSVSLKELLELSGTASQLSLSSFRVKGSHAGQNMSRLFGRGMEFAESRHYQEGDDIRAIDWRVTARTGKVHTKLFGAEKERQVLLCADLRSPMFFATKGVFKSVQASLIMGHLAWSASQGGNRLGGLLFDNENHDEFRPTLGKRGVLPFLQRLAEKAAFKPDRNGEGSIPSMDQAIEAIKRVATPGSLIVMASDFRRLSSYASDLLIQIARHSDIILCFLYDPLEASLPKNGYYPVSDGRNQLELNTFDKKNLELYQQQFIERREKVSSLRRGRHLQWMECSTQEDCFKLLKEHFR